EALWHGVRANIKKISEASDWQQVVYGMIEPVIEDQEFTERAATCVPDGPFTVESWANFISAVKEKTGAKGKKLFMPLRLALTGRSHGPEMGPLFALIGADKARNRLRGNKG
ncbi:MAG: glutamate--tRNA ligase, partial [Pseudomonadota bacterium]